MRQKLRIAACALAAFACLSAETSNAPQPANDPFTRLLATPRYYRISASGGMKNQDGSRMCLGGAALRRLVDGFREAAKDPQAVATLNNGCTQKTVRDGGSFSSVRECDKAKGATFTSHTRISGTVDEVHQHFEVTLNGFGPNGGDKTIISDVAMTYVGECPANVKPGQVLRPDGSVLDPLADLTSKPGEAKEATDAEYIAQAESRVLAEVKNPNAHIISIKADGRIPKACGWIDLGPGRGITVFQVRGRPGEEFSEVFVPEAGGESRKDRVASLYYRQLTLEICNQVVPPAPAGAFVESPTSRELAALWAEGPNKKTWAVIEPSGDSVFVGVSRRNGGGLITTPGFRSRDEVGDWLRAEGDTLAEKAQAVGAAAMKRQGECFAKAKDNAAMDQCPSDGMDEVVELAPSDEWKHRVVINGSAR